MNRGKKEKNGQIRILFTLIFYVSKKGFENEFRRAIFCSVFFIFILIHCKSKRRCNNCNSANLDSENGRFHVEIYVYSRCWNVDELKARITEAVAAIENAMLGRVWYEFDHRPWCASCGDQRCRHWTYLDILCKNWD